MSGAKRGSQYRKGVTAQYLLEAEELQADDVVVRITANSGGQIFAAERADGTAVQVKLPNKFHKVIWIKPGDLVVLDNQEAEIIDIKTILSKDMVKQLSKQGGLPERFRAAGVERKGYDMASIMPSARDEEEEEEGDEEEEQTPAQG